MDKNELAPILLFVYNRQWHTEQTINALLKNAQAAESDLIIYSDGAKNELDEIKVESVRNYLRTIKGFKSVRVIERRINFGLGNNIIDGVSETLKEFQKVIVLEDDLLTTPDFLEYMNGGLKIYNGVKNVVSIHAYIYPIKRHLPETFFIKGADCLGWATWQDKWEIFDSNGNNLLKIIQSRGLTNEFDLSGAYPYTRMLEDQIAGKNTSWAVRWYASSFIHEMLTLYPGRSLVYHNGNDGSGTNFGVSSFLDVDLSKQPIDLKYIIPSENNYARRQIIRYLKYGNASHIQIISRKAKRFLVSRFNWLISRN